MDEKYSIRDFKNVIILKKQLITLDLDQLKEIYQDFDSYLVFLDTIAVMSNVDSAFLLLHDDFIPKIESIIQCHRFDVDSDTWNLVNDAIQYLNLVKNYTPDYKKLLIGGYRAYQEDVRGKKVKDIDELLLLLAGDAYLVVGMEEKDIDVASDDDYFMSSLNYFIETCPEILEEEDMIPCLIQERLNSISKGNWFRRNNKYLQFTTKHYQKVKQKGE